MNEVTDDEVRDLALKGLTFVGSPTTQMRVREAIGRGLAESDRDLADLGIPLLDARDAPDAGTLRESTRGAGLVRLQEAACGFFTGTLE